MKIDRSVKKREKKRDEQNSSLCILTTHTSSNFCHEAHKNSAARPSPFSRLRPPLLRPGRDGVGDAGAGKRVLRHVQVSRRYVEFKDDVPEHDQEHGREDSQRLVQELVQHGGWGAGELSGELRGAGVRRVHRSA